MTLVPEGSVRFPNGAEVPDYRASDFFDEKEAGFLDRFAQFAAIAAREAVVDSAIAFANQIRENTAIVTGSCVGGQTTEDEGFHGLYAMNNPRTQPLTIPKTMATAGASRISLEFGITGSVYTVSTACSSANHAIGQAFWMVRKGTGCGDRTSRAEVKRPTYSLGFLKALGSDARVGLRRTLAALSPRDRRGLIHR